MSKQDNHIDINAGSDAGTIEEFLSPEAEAMGGPVDATVDRDSKENDNSDNDKLPDPPMAGNGGPAAADSGQTELRKVKAERDSLFDRLARQQAEFENLRKRAQKEQMEFRDYVAADFAKSLLPILDNFDLALRVGGMAKTEDLRQGVELIRKQMEEVLTKFGVQPIETKGQQFDPHQHEAIEMVDTSEAPDNSVLEELQRGYKIKERLLRPAMVRVARNNNS